MILFVFLKMRYGDMGNVSRIVGNNEITQKLCKLFEYIVKTLQCTDKLTQKKNINIYKNMNYFNTKYLAKRGNMLLYMLCFIMDLYLQEKQSEQIIV